MLTQNLSIGQLVIATSGRDEGEGFFIVGFPKDGYVLLANGKQRKILQPKLKKVKHIKKTNTVCYELKERLQSEEDVTDAFLRKKLASYR